MKRLLFFSILFLAAALAVSRSPRFPLIWEAIRKQAVDEDLLKNADTDLGYVLTDDQWISFPLTGNTRKIKVVSNAGTTKEISMLPAEEYRYTLEYEIRSKGENEVLQKGRFYHLSKLTRYQHAEAEELHAGSLYLDPEIIPVDGRVLTLQSVNGPSGQKAEVMRIRLAEKAPNVKDVLLRVYTIEQSTQPQELYNWQRFSIQWRQQHARGNVYPYDFLSDEEKINLLNNQWSVVGPLGVPGRDYRVRVLYTLKVFGDEPFFEDAAQYQPSIGPQQVMTLAIPVEGMNLRFTFTPGMPQVQPSGKSVKIEWFGSTPARRNQLDVPLNDSGETVVESSFALGLLEIRAPVPMDVAIQKRTEHGWEDWRPQPLYSRATLCDSMEGVVFTIGPGGSEPIPLRLSLRVPISLESRRQVKVEYELLGLPGGKGQFLLTSQPSRYDRLVVQGMEAPVSEPVIYFWNLPPQVTGIRLTSTAPVLISAATRPYDLAHLVRVPEDYQRTSINDPERQSVWFPVLPDAYLELFQQQRSVLLHIQQRPPVDDPNLLAGQYLYESLRPSLQWTGRYLLLPPDREPGLRPPASTSIFYPLLQGMNRVNITDENKMYVARPQLLFFRENNTLPVSVTMDLDGRPYFKTQLHGLSGQVRLPALDIGEHRLSVSVSGKTSLYMNYLQRKEEGYQLRFATRLTEKGLFFDYQRKEGEKERLSFAFFSPEAGKRTIIRVRLLPEPMLSGGPGPDYTLFDRRFDIKGPETEPVRILSLGKRRVGEGRKFFFPTGGDLPPGKYTIAVSLEDGPGGYIILSRITPGIYASRRLNREQLQLEAEPHATWN